MRSYFLSSLVMAYKKSRPCHYEQQLKAVAATEPAKPRLFKARYLGTETEKRNHIRW